MISLNGYKIVPTIFPDKTSQVWKIPQEYLSPVSHIIWEFENEAELIHLAQLQFLLKEINRFTILEIPYLPYARQDKCITNDATFALQPFARIIAGMDFNKIVTFDAHSKVFGQMMDSENIEPTDEINAAIKKTNSALIGYPDGGAWLRYSHLLNREYICAEKKRDPRTGWITELTIKNQTDDFKERSVLIVDDICDGGATFIMFAKLLYKQGASEVSLYTSHGIYSKGIQVLKDAGITRIFNRKGEVL